jgi:ectoine hydroxylase-related dioxygenase (phytanoyl-CoA dioxygenase family)
MDTPQDTKNTLNWHQDISYFPQNFDGKNGLVVSTALQDTPEEMGALHVCVGSQHESAMMPEYGANSKAGVSEQRELSNSIVARHSVATCEMQKGDTLIFNLNLFHSSGYNKSKRIRFSTLCRYHKMVEEDYVPFRLYHKYNSAAIERVLKNRGELGQVFRSFYEKG